MIFFIVILSYKLLSLSNDFILWEHQSHYLAIVTSHKSLVNQLLFSMVCCSRCHFTCQIAFTSNHLIRSGCVYLSYLLLDHRERTDLGVLDIFTDVVYLFAKLTYSSTVIQSIHFSESTLPWSGLLNLSDNFHFLIALRPSIRSTLFLTDPRVVRIRVIEVNGIIVL